MKTIFFIIGAFSRGGAERAVSTVSLNLPQNSQSKIILFGRDEPVEYPYKGELIYLDKFRRSNKLNKALSVVNRIVQIRRLKSNHPDALFISFLEYPNFLNLFSGCKAKTMISVRNHMTTKNRSGLKSHLWNLINRTFYHKADKIIAVSEEVKQDLIANYNCSPQAVEVIYNAYDTDKILEMSKSTLEAIEIEIFRHPVIITVGRLITQKAQWHMIRALSEVRKKVPDAQLVFLGEGDRQTDLAKLAQSLGLCDSVHFLGFQQNPFRLIAKARVFALTSIHEGFPNALVEAMACGVPVVATDCHSGPREILAPDEPIEGEIESGWRDGRFGVIIPNDESRSFGVDQVLTISEMALAETIIQIVSCPDFATKLGSLSLVRASQFHIKNLIKEWQHLAEE